MTTTATKRWSPAFMAPVAISRDQAIGLAHRYDVVIAAASSVRSWLDDMRAANPNIQVLAYINGTFSLHDDGTRYPVTWYAHDANGKLITSVYDNTLMEPNSTWANNVATRAKGLVEQGFDGVLVDTLGTAIFAPGYVSGLPVNQETGITWTAVDWLNATVAIARTVKTALGTSKMVVPNGIAMGSKYFDTKTPTRKLLAGTGVDAGMVELFVRPPFASPTSYRSELLWKQDVDMLLDAHANGFALYTTTKTWVNMTDAQKKQWHEYALATYLMGADSLDRFAFLPEQSWAAVSADNPWDVVDLGLPAGVYAKVGGVYKRVYAQGMVLANPTTSTVTVDLGGPYVTLEGVRVSRVTLARGQGAVLRKAPNVLL